MNQGDGVVILCANSIGDLRSSDFLRTQCTCECGKTHSVNIEKVIIDNGAIRKIPELLKEFGYKSVFIMADDHTYKAAGNAVEDVLRGQFAYQTFVYHREEELVPDERAVGELLIHFAQDVDVVIAVGAGVINDLAKYASHKMGVPYIIVATAPSMDGFASDGAALIVDNVKVSYPMANVKAIIGDVDVLKLAPKKMIAAGLGDMLGKYSALRDWKLGAVIENEYYCNVVVAMVEKAVERCIHTIEGLCRRDDEAIKNLMEGLVLTGIAMSFAGTSRPASGSEHHLSHFWEMMFLLGGKKAVLHGTKVGIASVIISKMSKQLASQSVDWIACEEKAKTFDFDGWKENIKRVYKDSAPGILKMAEAGNRHSLAERRNRVEAIWKNWSMIAGLLSTGPSPQQIETWLKQTGAPVHPSEVGIEKADLVNGILYAKEIRTRYSILQLLGDLGLLEQYAYEQQEQYA